MGRITLFTSDHCLYSLQVKHALKKRNLPFTEINLTEFPDKRTDLFALTRRMTTPASFFNTRYVGGTVATLRLLKEWDADKNYESPAKKYESQIARYPDPSSRHLAIPEKAQESAPNKTTTSSIPIKPITAELQLPSGPKTYRVSELQEELSRVLPLASLPYHLTSYKKSVTGARATSALKAHFNCSTRQEAEEIGKQLGSLGLLWHVCFDHDFMDTEKLYYRLQCHQTPDLLNSMYMLQDNVDNDVDRANVIAKRMQDLLHQLEVECFSVEKGVVHYGRGVTRAAFAELQEGICYFQTISLFDMTPAELLAFGLNVYNILLKFAFFKYGVPKKESHQQTFLRDIYFNIGGDLYSFCEWAYTISGGNVSRLPKRCSTGARISLRSVTNNSNNNSFSSLQSSKFGFLPDVESRSVCSPADCRVHFATNFFRTRGTAVSHFTAENLEKELNVMALAFVADDDNVLIDPKRGELRLSNIFAWYRPDFNSIVSFGGGSDDNDKILTQVIAQYTESPKKLSLQPLLYSGNGKKVKISFHSDDWTTNAGKKGAEPFAPASLEANATRF